MSNTLEQMNRKIANAEQLESVVRTMKAQAASSIVQYEIAVKSLVDYFHTVELGLTACFLQNPHALLNLTQPEIKYITAIVFGSDQGLVGQFNEQLVKYMYSVFETMIAVKTIIAVGEHVYQCLDNKDFTVKHTLDVPNSVGEITSLISNLVIKISAKQNEGHTLIVFYNLTTLDNVYQPMHQKLLPLDRMWQKSLAQTTWPTKNMPEIIDNKVQSTLSALISEYLFILLFRACAESLASENASRLAAMNRAEKNINEMLGELKQKSRAIRQNAIDEELFDLIASYHSKKL